MRNRSFRLNSTIRYHMIQTETEQAMVPVKMTSNVHRRSDVFVRKSQPLDAAVCLGASRSMGPALLDAVGRRLCRVDSSGPGEACRLETVFSLVWPLILAGGVTSVSCLVEVLRVVLRTVLSDTICPLEPEAPDRPLSATRCLVEHTSASSSW